MSLNVFLEFGICFARCILLADLDVFGPVIAYDTAPESVVEVEGECLLILAVNGLDDVRKVEGELGDRADAHGILVAVPVGGVCPALDAIAGRHIIYIVDVEGFMCFGIFGEPAVELCDEGEPAAVVGYV